MEQLYEVKRPIVKITIYKSHVEIVDRSGCFGTFQPRKISIPIRSISAVDISMTKAVMIKTLDGKSYKYPIGGLGKEAENIRDAIFKAMG